MMDFSLPLFSKAFYLTNNIVEKMNSKYSFVKLNDPDKFSIRIGRRVISKEIVKDGKYPIYSANVKVPFGYIDHLLFDDFSKDSILWGIDGDWMVGYVHKKTPFYPTDHCGVITVIDNDIEPYYIALALEIIGVKYGFSRTYRASTERISAVQLPLPPKIIQQQIVKECEAIDEEYNTSRMTIEDYRKKINEIFDKLEIVNKTKIGG